MNNPFILSVFLILYLSLFTSATPFVGYGQSPDDCQPFDVPQGADWVSESTTAWNAVVPITTCQTSVVSSFFCTPPSSLCNLTLLIPGSCGPSAGFYDCATCTSALSCSNIDSNILIIPSYYPGQAQQRVEAIGFAVQTYNLGILNFNVSRCMSSKCWSDLGQEFLDEDSWFISTYPANSNFQKRSILGSCSVNYFSNSITCSNGTYFAVDLLNTPINVTGSSFYVSDYFVFCDDVQCFSPFHIGVPTSTSTMPLWAFILSWVVSFVLFLAVAFVLCRVLPAMCSPLRM